jgi:hypothetical protein
MSLLLSAMAFSGSVVEESKREDGRYPAGVKAGYG